MRMDGSRWSNKSENLSSHQLSSKSWTCSKLISEGAADESR